MVKIQTMEQEKLKSICVCVEGGGGCKLCRAWRPLGSPVLLSRSCFWVKKRFFFLLEAVDYMSAHVMKYRMIGPGWVAARIYWLA
jgi:hypothetical protein